ncbi:MAG: hypothetical protein JWM19_945 [Actinomycetia bacterium]|nr:hypothetical protein [Actinomycetes bacterium]
MTKIVIKDDGVTVESPEEALFYGLMRLWKIPCERGDRSRAIDVNGSGWYCPDFYLPDLDAWVEVKGFEEEDHRLRYDCWRISGKRLAVLKPGELHALRQSWTRDGAIGYLNDLAMGLQLFLHGCITSPQCDVG